MAETQDKALKVGGLVFAALTILLITIYLIGSKDNLFTPKKNIVSIFKDVRGVVVGNNVRFSGINVGTVKDIKITSDSTVVLTLSISNKYAQYIYKNSVVDINQDGLMGGKIVSISGGTFDTGHIEDNDILKTKPGIDIENYISKVDEILIKTSDTMTKLNEISQKINSGNGDIAQLLNNDYLISQLKITTQRLNSSLANVNEISQKINSGKGDLGKLVNENNITSHANEILTNLKQTSKKADVAVENLTATTRTINEGDGAITYLLKSPKLTNDIDTTIQNVNVSLEQFNKTAKAIEESWIVRLFSKKNKKEKGKQVQTTQPDTIQ